MGWDGPQMSGLGGGRGTDCLGPSMNWGFTLMKREATEEFYVGDEMTWLGFEEEPRLLLRMNWKEAVKAERLGRKLQGPSREGEGKQADQA